jgi:uroporphyrin-III C-methyltransferase
MNAKANMGTVFLIGAGPGDPELLTLKAAKAIQRCDVLLVDDLVDRAVLEHAKPNARVINVGKRGGCKSTPQQFIERMMIRFARAGAMVGRIKGGDPFVFGRGGEEMLALRDAGINVTVVPGVTAGCAAPGALHIPVTHRDFSRGVTFITGHTKTDAALNYSALAHSDTTLVIYMGITNLSEIAEGLIAAGMPRNTPACAIRNGTWQDQVSVIATLETLALDVAEAKLTSPAIIVIGEVVSLAKRDNIPAIGEESRCAA